MKAWGLPVQGLGVAVAQSFRALGTLPAVQVWGFGAQAQAKGGLQSEKPHGKHQIPSSFPRFTCGLSLAACSNHHDVLHVMLNLLVFATKSKCRIQCNSKWSCGNAGFPCNTNPFRL